MTRPGMAILGDSAFVKCINSGKVMRMRKEKGASDIPESAVLAAVDKIVQLVLPEERQSVEWRIRALKGAFKRLLVPLQADSMKRLRTIRTCRHLHNFRTRYPVVNQIRSTYSAPM